MNRRSGSSSRAAFLLLCVGAAFPALSAAEELSELNRSFIETAQRLDEEIRLYGDSREREREAIAEFLRMNTELDEMLADPNTSRNQLVRHEVALAAARNTMVSRAEESTTSREAMYGLMATLAELVEDYEREGVDVGPPRDQVGGTWRAEVQPSGVFGLFGLRQDRAIVSGSYRLSNGARGSVRGTFSGGRVRLELVDSAGGPIGSIEGRLDPVTDEIRGTWQALELTSGRPAGGEWFAERLTIEDVLELEP